MFSRGLLFQWTSTIKVQLQLSVLVLYKTDTIIILSNITSCRHDMAEKKYANLALNRNYPLTLNITLRGFIGVSVISILFHISYVIFGKTLVYWLFRQFQTYCLLDANYLPPFRFELSSKQVNINVMSCGHKSHVVWTSKHQYLFSMFFYYIQEYP